MTIEQLKIIAGATVTLVLLAAAMHLSGDSFKNDDNDDDVNCMHFPRVG